MNYTQEEIELAFEHFVSEAERIVTQYMAKNFPTLPEQHIEVNDRGRVYWKLFRVDGSPGQRGHSKSVYAFVRKSDGAIFKAASWSAPYTKGKSAIRGYVTDEWASSLITPHGVIYAR